MKKGFLFLSLLCMVSSFSPASQADTLIIPLGLRAPCQDKPDGKHIQYYENGRPYYVADCVGEKINGYLRVYTKAGSLWSLTRYVAGLKQGWAVQYDNQGKFVAYKYFKNGQDTSIQFSEVLSPPPGENAVNLEEYFQSQSEMLEALWGDQIPQGGEPQVDHPRLKKNRPDQPVELQSSDTSLTQEKW